MYLRRHDISGTYNLNSRKIADFFRKIHMVEGVKTRGFFTPFFRVKPRWARVSAKCKDLRV